MKRLHTHGQHFLRNPRFVAELIGHTSIKKSDIVYDIGAGSGVITSVLAKKCKEVIAVEYDKQTAEILKKNVAGYENVTIIVDDFLKLPMPQSPYKIFANIPFHLSSSILQKITSDNNPPEATYVIVQKQFANKLLPDHKGFSSQLGMILGVRYSFRVRKRLKRTDFWPFPNVDTVLLEIIPRSEPLIESEKTQIYKTFIHENFVTPNKFRKLPLEILSRETIPKPSELTLNDWVSLFRATH